MNWDDAKTYVAWLSRETGKRYRLLSESEWEYVARAGSASKYTWGNSVSCTQARYGHYSGSCGDEKQTLTVGRFAANGFGLFDVHGNVWEWTQDCWNESYKGAPTDGSAWQRGDCDRRVLRGGSWFFGPERLRSAFRYRFAAAYRFFDSGFRVAQDL